MTFHVYLSSGPGRERRIEVEANTAPGAESIALRDHVEAGETIRLVRLADSFDAQSKYGV